MSAAAVTMGAAGLLLQFAPVEVMHALGAAPDAVVPLLAQVTGALLLGFAMTDWMSRGARMGGIYARPLVTGNLLHFVTGGLALLKGASASSSLALWGVTAIYAALAIAFTIVLLTHPGEAGALPPR